MKLFGIPEMEIGSTGESRPFGVVPQFKYPEINVLDWDFLNDLRKVRILFGTDAPEPVEGELNGEELQHFD